jgi:hypothetical protein
VRAYLYLDSANWNDGVNTFLLRGIQLPRRDIVFDEVRAYTGAIRQVDVHQPLTKAVIPLMIKGTDMADLEGHLKTILDGCVAGGTLTFQEATDIGTRGTSKAYQVGKSPEPEVIHDYAYRHRYVALVVAELWVAL